LSPRDSQKIRQIELRTNRIVTETLAVIIKKAEAEEKTSETVSRKSLMNCLCRENECEIKN